MVLNLFLIIFCLLLDDMKDVYKWDVECAQIHKVVKQMEEIRLIRIAGSFSDSSLFFKLTIAL